jgi:dCTP diphosphatase
MRRLDAGWRNPGNPARVPDDSFQRPAGVQRVHVAYGLATRVPGYPVEARDGYARSGFRSSQQTRKAADMANFEDIRQQLREFSTARDWDQFHSPKNLAMALIVEAAELVEHFQWLSEEQSAALPASKLAAVAEEVADIQIFLIRLADRLDIDLDAAVAAKMVVNEQKYPLEKARGSAMKYTEFDDGD